MSAKKSAKRARPIAHFTDLGLHEVLDRVAVIERTFDEFVAGSPALQLKSRRKLLKQADRVGAALFDLYQAIGRAEK